MLELRKRIQKEWPLFKAVDDITPEKWSKFTHKGKVMKDEFGVRVKNYYLNDSICRASDTMKECVKSFETQNFQEAAE